MGHIIAVIPARSGSKSVTDKNIRIMNGKPLLAYSIESALKSKKVERVIVSTDSSEYQRIALEYGAEVPFLRPTEFAQDTSLDIDVFYHALNWLKENENYDVDICVHLRPTHPVRKDGDIDKMIDILEKDLSVDSVRSVSPAKQTPYKMWRFSDDGSTMMTPVVTCAIPEAYNAPRQVLPEVYTQNACIDVIRGKTILEMRSMTGTAIAGYYMDFDYDIDTENDFLNTEKAQLLLDTVKSKRVLKICCDIDGVIAKKTPDNDYSSAVPLERNISIINALYDKGHHIVLFTARGYQTGIDWKQTTKEQMDIWGVKHHELIFGKPDADVYLDDKSFDLDMLRSLI